MRITSGKLKNKKIATSIKGLENKFRPTTERTRMAVFNIIDHSPHCAGVSLDGCNLIDICAGSGAFGLEAISRGAEHVTFVEIDTNQLKLLRANIENLGVPEECEVIRADATKLSPMHNKFDIAFIDPPYKKGLVNNILKGLLEKGIMHDENIIIAELQITEDIAPTKHIEVLDSRSYGKTKIVTCRIKYQ